VSKITKIDQVVPEIATYVLPCFATTSNYEEHAGQKEKQR